MTTLTLTTEVADDRKVTLQLPPTVAPGKHQIRVEIDPFVNEDSVDDLETPLRWEGGVLVYAGEAPPGNVCDWIEQAREDRIQELIRRSTECE
jgi:hypothetical protein